MRRNLVGIWTLAMIVIWAAAPSAHACGGGGGSALGAVPLYGIWVGSLAGSGVATAAYTISDLSRAAKKTRPDRKHAASEIMTMSMATAVGAIYSGVHLGFASYESYDKMMLTVGILGVVETVWSAALLGHGIWEYRRAVREGGDTPAPENGKLPQFSLAPTLVAEGSNRGAGLCVLGRF